VSSYLLDTNILIRLVLPHDPLCPVATSAVDELKRRGDTACIATQNLVEFWNVATCPVEANGLGMTPDKAAVEVDRIEAMFRLLDDRAGVYARWRTLVGAHCVSGRQVYDARLVALMLEHGVDRILTFNADDFTRYSEIVTVTPTSLIATPA
jgi:predicted nucleic acid-binding protein